MIKHRKPTKAWTFEQHQLCGVFAQLLGRHNTFELIRIYLNKCVKRVIRVWYLQTIKVEMFKFMIKCLNSTNRIFKSYSVSLKVSKCFKVFKK